MAYLWLFCFRRHVATPPLDICIRDNAKLVSCVELVGLISLDDMQLAPPNQSSITCKYGNASALRLAFNNNNMDKISTVRPQGLVHDISHNMHMAAELVRPITWP